MTEARRARWRWAGSIGWVAAVAAVLAGVLLSPDVRQLADGAFRELTWRAVLATVPVQFASTLLCAGALAVLGPGVPFRASLLSRLLRDGGGNLLVIVPGLGELIGARALVLSGGTARAAAAASALDVLAESIAQVPFVCLTLVALPKLAGHLRIGHAAFAWLALGLLAAGTFAAVLWLASRSWRRRARHLTAGLVALARRQLGDARAAWRRRRGAMPAAIGLHLIAWALGGVQVWLAARALGMPLGLVDAIVVESAAYAVRALLFLVPAGVGVQEAGFVVAGTAMGLRAEQALALSLVLRARDLALGLPVLLLWPAIEWRQGMLARAPSHPKLTR